MPQPLTVYKASAGSGKTFRLTVEYIKHLIIDPTGYRHILAVTFTNKATEEMKMRILSTLYGIANNLADSDNELGCIADELGKPKEEVRRQAAIALQLLIHNYSHFHVETIDTFFQSVLRNLARELDLTANLRIELNDRQVEEQAVDVMIANLSQTSEQLRWIMDFIRKNIEDDKTWNVIKSIKDFGANIFKDKYKENARHLESSMRQPGFFEQVSKQLAAIEQGSKNAFQKACDDFQAILRHHQVTVADFSNGERGACGYFLKLAKGLYDDKSLLTKRVADALQDASTMVKRTDNRPGSPVLEAAKEAATLMAATEQDRPRLLKAYASATITRRHLSQLRLLGDIEQTVRGLNAEANRFLLSDTQTMLSHLIEDSDSPFIFEKIGTRLQHIMIDEFQDTSRVQWRNFKVLLHECMSHTKAIGGVAANLIVGDVKQSIYRWRDGDWQLLNGIDRTEFTSQEVDIHELNVNRRSDSRIIRFNNAFFPCLVRHRQERAETGDGGSSATNASEERLEEATSRLLQDIYKDVCQQVPEGKADEGSVRIELLPKGADYHQRMLDRLEATLRNLIADRHVAPGKIAIIVRANRTIQEIAAFLSERMPEVRLVSDEAFRLDASAAVKVLVSALRVLADPTDTLATAELATLWKTQIEGDDAFLTRLAVIREEKKADDESPKTPSPGANRFLDSLPPAFSCNVESLRAMPVYDLAERLSDIFGLQKAHDQDAYVAAFFDQLASFLQATPGDIADFLALWDDSLCKKSIQNGTDDGIRLITIHKSKGLEFDHVVMPFADWQLEQQGYTIWTSPQEPPYNALGAMPVDFYRNQLVGSVYEDDYQKEHMQNIVDNLNLLYVAFTRARRSLTVMGRRDAPGTRSIGIENCLPALADNLDGCSFDEGGDDTATVLTYGSPDDGTHESRKKTSANIFRQEETDVTVEFHSTEASVRFRQSSESQDFMRGDDGEDRRKAYIRTGSILHKVFSTIRTLDDIDPALRQMERQGILYDSNISEARLRQRLSEALQNPTVRDWFSARWTLFNECNILSPHADEDGKKERRPDRVMLDGDEMVVVDFKFGRKSERHIRQVQGYMRLLKAMGYPHVKGYLWYVLFNEVEPVP